MDIERVERHVIENKLLAALNDDKCVAILATKEDLVMLIDALESAPGSAFHTKRREYSADLRKLLKTAFPQTLVGEK